MLDMFVGPGCRSKMLGFFGGGGELMFNLSCSLLLFYSFLVSWSHHVCYFIFILDSFPWQMKMQSILDSVYHPELASLSSPAQLCAIHHTVLIVLTIVLLLIVITALLIYIASLHKTHCSKLM